MVKVHRIRDFLVGSDALERFDSIDSQELLVEREKICIIVQFLSEDPDGVLIADERPQCSIDECAFRASAASTMISGLVALDDLEIVVAAAEGIEILRIGRE